MVRPQLLICGPAIGVFYDSHLGGVPWIATNDPGSVLMVMTHSMRHGKPI